LIEVRRIDAAKEVASLLAKSDRVTYLPSGNGKDGSGSNLLLNVGK
jgi:prohibitin 1